MDFITRLPLSTKGCKVYDSILVIVDRFTKCIQYILALTKWDTMDLANAFFNKHILKGLGALQSIITNRGIMFVLEFWKALCCHIKI